MRRERFKTSIGRIDWLRRERELHLRIASNDPMHFHWVPATEGTAVEFPMFVYHLTFHDMAAFAMRQLLTEEVLMAGLRVNAVSREEFIRLDAQNGILIVQPRWVDGHEPVDAELWNEK